MTDLAEVRARLEAIAAEILAALGEAHALGKLPDAALSACLGAPARVIDLAQPWSGQSIRLPALRDSLVSSCAGALRCADGAVMPLDGSAGSCIVIPMPHERVIARHPVFGRLFCAVKRSRAAIYEFSSLRQRYIALCRKNNGATDACAA